MKGPANSAIQSIEKEFDKPAIRVYIYKNMDKYPLEYRKNSVFLLLFPMHRDIISLSVRAAMFLLTT
jgi:hypothetical protein